MPKERRRRNGRWGIHPEVVAEALEHGVGGATATAMRAPRLGIRCVVAQQQQACTTCTRGLCALCGIAGRWVREGRARPLRQRRIVKVFWELRVHVGRANTLRAVRACKHCDAIAYGVLNSAARLTMQRMQAAMRHGTMGAEQVFWHVLVGEREGAFGTNWEHCPRCGQSHSVHGEQCSQEEMNVV